MDDFSDFPQTIFGPLPPCFGDNCCKFLAIKKNGGGVLFLVVHTAEFQATTSSMLVNVLLLELHILLDGAHPILVHENQVVENPNVTPAVIFLSNLLAENIPQTKSIFFTK